MSPPFVDLRSPLTYPPQMQPKQPPFAPQNPNPNPNGGFDCGLSSPFVSRMSSEKPSRSKPRLAKTRRHIGSPREKSTSVPTQNDPGLNRFNFVSGNSNQFKNDSSGISSAFSASIGGVMRGKLNNACFVFEANNGSLLSNLNSGKNQTSGTIEQASGDGFGRFDNRGFVFGVNKCSSEHGESSEGFWQSDANEFGKFENVGILFGENKSSSLQNFLNSENRQSNGRVQQFSADEFGKFNDLGFVFGTSKSKNSEWRASGKNVGQKHVDELRKYNKSAEKSESWNYAGFMDDCIAKLNSVVNTTSASGTSSVSKLSDEIRKMSVGGCENIGCSDNTKDTNINSSASSNPMFVFGSNKNVPGSSTGKSVTASCGQMKNTNLQSPASLDDPSVGVSTAKPFIFGAGPRKSSDVPQDQLNDDPKLNITSNRNLFSSSGLAFEATSACRVENKDSFSSPSIPVGVCESTAASRTPNGDESCSFMENLCPELNINLEFNGKSRSIRGKRLNKMRGKWRNTIPVQQQYKENHVSQEGVQQDLASPVCYSPMDFSPYQDNNCTPTTVNAASSTREKDENLAAARKGANTNKGDKTCRDPNVEDSKNYRERVVADSSLEEAETECGISNSEQISTKSGGGGGSGAGNGVTSNTKSEKSECENQFCFPPREEDISERNFTFSASSTQDTLTVTKRSNRKKYRMKVGRGSHCTTPSQNVDATPSTVQFSHLDSTYLHPILAQDKEGSFNSQRKRDDISRVDEKHEKQGSTAATQEACEKWRIRGNQAYEKGSLSRAEEFYTKGINSVRHSETSGVEPLMLCYSNRAAARMSSGRMREALGDCMMAAALDPHFHKVQIRAANCHLALGEVEDALHYFCKCLESGGGICLDRRIIIEAADGLQNAQKVANCMDQCAELLRQRTYDAAISALEIISTALSLSSYSETLLEMKGEVLLMLQRYAEVIQLCEQTLESAVKNFAVAACDNKLLNADCPNYNNSSIRLWRWRLMSKSYFHLGRLELALDLLEKQELLRSSEDRCGSNGRESSIPFAVTVRELLHHKNAGNEAYQSGRHSEAVEHYTAVVSNSIESRPFAAICFCNRAAANQALAQIADAIADCSIAIALDGSYSKALSRRATLHETIRDYKQAASDLQRLISLLKKQSQEKVRQSGTPDKPIDSTVKELTKAHRHLHSVEEKAKKGTSLDHYLILGIKASDTAAEIKKAYRKAALRHHPDKAGQFLARSDIRDDGKLWKEIADEVHKDSDRLFKMIGEAYAVLSDPTKRSEYDLQEEIRNAQKESNGSRASRGPSDFYSSPFRSNGNRRYWQESSKTYQNSRSQW
ncbi:DnaJ subfamily C member like [Actinidia chinensis var. chinensis]|uniref:DnaJ subfamily C member like n=1 Tax=Actinidia chinensis var. chinensis TaxID=1590841 RepID=A0A2R6RU38_ACTCC|nr:DnaJ subfamily C member like [Actinidia chinensis var. chinensis]